MIDSSGNSGGVVVGALVYGTEFSGFKSLFILFFSFSLVEIFLSSREPFQHGASIACYMSYMHPSVLGKCQLPPMYCISRGHNIKVWNLIPDKCPCMNLKIVNYVLVPVDTYLGHLINICTVYTNIIYYTNT